MLLSSVVRWNLVTPKKKCKVDRVPVCQCNPNVGLSCNYLVDIAVHLFAKLQALNIGVSMYHVEF